MFTAAYIMNPQNKEFVAGILLKSTEETQPHPQAHSQVFNVKINAEN